MSEAGDTNEIMLENAKSVKSAPETSEHQTTAKKSKSKPPKAVKRRKTREASTEEEEEQEQEEEEGGKRKPSNPRSWVWDHFSKVFPPNSKTPRAKCNWCAITYACDSHKNGTSNMSNHLLSQCKKFPREVIDLSLKVLTLQDFKKEDGKGMGSHFAAVSFDNEACRQALARWTIVDELSFKHVEGERFRYFMSVASPKMSIPRRLTCARDCWNLYLNERNKLKSVFASRNQSVCLTTDCWTSVQNLNYLCLTAHFIDENWKLHKRILNLCLIKSHKGETIGRKIEKCLLSWEMSKVFSITNDNASSNDVAISYLRTRMEDWNTHPLKGEYLHVRCCAHILNLVVNDGLRELHASASKIRNAIRFVSGSPGCIGRFKTAIKECKIQEKCTVQLDSPTRWNSTYLMLESALKFQKAFKRLGERDAEFALLQGGIPRVEDWENAHVCEILENF